MDALRLNGRRRGLLDVGYHLVIDREGIIHRVRDIESVGSHTPGYNHLSIGVCLIGGRGDAGRVVDNFTPIQKGVLVLLGAGFLIDWPDGRIAGHHELRGYSNAGTSFKCPMLKDINELRLRMKEGARIGWPSLRELTASRKKDTNQYGLNAQEEESHTLTGSRADLLIADDIIA